MLQQCRAGAAPLCGNDATEHGHRAGWPRAPAPRCPFSQWAWLLWMGLFPAEDSMLTQGQVRMARRCVRGQHCFGLLKGETPWPQRPRLQQNGPLIAGRCLSHRAAAPPGVECPQSGSSKAFRAPQVKGQHQRIPMSH